jgi:hypothetical protein
MARSNSSPATRMDLENTMPESEMMAISVVPPPMSTIMLAAGSSTGRPTPRAAAMGSRMVMTSRAPAWVADSFTARFSTSVMPEGMAMTTRGETTLELLCTLLDEVAQHRLGDVEVGDDAVLHRADGGDVAWGAAEHLLGFVADGQDLAGGGVDRDDGRLAQHDALVLDVDEGVGGAQVDADVVGEKSQQLVEHCGGGGGLRNTSGRAEKLSKANSLAKKDLGHGLRA